jgi:hypothetical protein
LGVLNYRRRGERAVPDHFEEWLDVSAGEARSPGLAPR